jgi:hypothetical protein
MNFILRPNKQVMDSFAHITNILLDPSVVTIGLQIRGGDAVMKGEKTSDALSRVKENWRFFQCAEALSDVLITRPNQTVKWYLIGDDALLREGAKKIYGDRIITMLQGESGMRIGHTDPNDRRIYNSKSEQFMPKNLASTYLQMAAGEQWLLAYCDRLVIDQYRSGFGRSAALRSMRVGHAWDGRYRGSCKEEVGFLTTNHWAQIGHFY